MTYVHDKSKSKLPLGKVLDKGFNITPEDNKKTVANTHVIDTNKRKVSDKVNKSEPSFTE